MRQKFFKYKHLTLLLMCLAHYGVFSQNRTESINVYFDSNSSTISPDDKSRLQDFYFNVILPDTMWFYKMESAGFTDSTGNKKNNQLLSKDRALSVLRFMDSIIDKGGDKQGCIDYLDACGHSQWSCADYRIRGLSVGLGEETRQNIIKQGKDSCRRVKLSFIDDRGFCLGFFNICALPESDTIIDFDDSGHLFINRGSIISPHVKKGGCIPDTLKAKIEILSLNHPLIDTAYHYDKSVELWINPTYRVYIPCGTNQTTLVDDIFRMQGYFQGSNNLDYISLDIKTNEFEKIVTTDHLGNEIPSHLTNKNNSSTLRIPIGDLQINNGAEKEIIHIYRKTIKRNKIKLIVKGRIIKQLNTHFENTPTSAKLIGKSSFLGLFTKRSYEIVYYSNVEDNYAVLEDSKKDKITVNLNSLLEHSNLKRDSTFLLKRNTVRSLFKDSDYKP